jgi:16S rRNA processing protein RimM
MPESTPLLEIGKLGRPHGLGGDLRIFLHNSRSDLADQLEALHLVSPDGLSEVLSVKQCRRSGDGRAIIVRTHEIKDRSDAERLTGWKLMVPYSQLAPLEDGEYYFFQLAQASVVTHSGSVVGVVQEVIESGVNTLRIVREGKSEIMVPIVNDFVLEIDATGGRITVVDEIEELLSLED